LHASGVHDLLGHPAAILDDFATRLDLRPVAQSIHSTVLVGRACFGLYAVRQDSASC